jgi:transposase-like protein
MQNRTNRKSAVLKEIKREFSAFRRGRQGRKGNGYPRGLRDLAVSGLEQGSSSSEVSEAAGVSGESLRNWRRDAQRAGVGSPTQPVELELVESKETLPGEGPLPCEAGASLAHSEAIARIHFRSGVQMALPVSALSDRLIGLLMRGAA